MWKQRKVYPHKTKELKSTHPKNVKNENQTKSTQKRPATDKLCFPFPALLESLSPLPLPSFRQLPLFSIPPLSSH